MTFSLQDCPIYVFVSVLITEEKRKRGDGGEARETICPGSVAGAHSAVVA